MGLLSLDCRLQHLPARKTKFLHQESTLTLWLCKPSSLLSLCSTLASPGIPGLLSSYLGEFAEVSVLTSDFNVVMKMHPGIALLTREIEEFF